MASTPSERPEQQLSPQRITVDETGATYRFDKWYSHDWDPARYVCRRCGLTRKGAVAQTVTPPCFTKVYQ